MKKDKTLKELNQLLCDTFTLYLKTHNFHWNVVGELFPQLHLLLEKQYNILFDQVDVIAERMRALGNKPKATLSQILKTTVIEESDDAPEQWQVMIRELINARKKVITQCEKLFKEATSENDQATANYSAELIFQHEKDLWMLKAIFKE